MVVNVNMRRCFVVLLCLVSSARTATTEDGDRTVHKDTVFCVRTGETNFTRWGWLFSSEDPIGCLENPKEYSEPCPLHDDEECKLSACQEITVPTIYGAFSSDEAGFCSDISIGESTPRRKMWCYYNLLGNKFCAAFSNQDATQPPDAVFQCNSLDPGWGFDFHYFGEQTIYMAPGSCVEQQIRIPNIFEGMTDKLLNEYNERLNAQLTCPFDSLAPARVDDKRRTKVEYKDCQANLCYPFDREFKEFTLTGQRVEAPGSVFENDTVNDILPFHAQLQDDQVCFSYDLLEMEIMGDSIDDINEYHRCESACVAVGDQVDLYWGNSTVNGITNVATRTIRISQMNDAVASGIKEGSPVKPEINKTTAGGNVKTIINFVLMGAVLSMGLVSILQYRKYKSRRQYEQAGCDEQEESTTEVDLELVGVPS